MRKLYCYIDESGPDTFAQSNRQHIFVVGVVVTDHDRDILSQVCEGYEQASDKGKFKWHHAERSRRLRYMNLIMHDPRFHGALCFSVFRHITRKDFDVSTIKGIAWAVQTRWMDQRYVVQVYVDGLSKKKRPEYRQGLKRLGVPVGEVKGIPREESSPLTRLADALAGMVRDAVLDDDIEARMILDRAVSQRLVAGEWL